MNGSNFVVVAIFLHHRRVGRPTPIRESQTAALLPITARVKPGAVLSQSHDKGRDNSFGLKSL